VNFHCGICGEGVECKGHKLLETYSTSRARVRKGALQNAPSARGFPAGSSNHEALAAYWGWECARSLTAIRDATSTNMQLDSEHAWRTGKMAAYHWAKHRGVKSDMFD